MTKPDTGGRGEGRRETKRIWVEVRGGGVILPEGRKYVAVIGRDYQEPKTTEYIRQDLVADSIRALQEARSVLASIRDPEARHDRDCALASIDAALQAQGDER